MWSALQPPQHSATLGGVVWCGGCGVVWCGVMWCGVYGVVWCGVLSGTLECTYVPIRLLEVNGSCLITMLRAPAGIVTAGL